MILQDYLSGRDNNFTLLRFFAALAVLYGHSYPLSLGLSGGEDVISQLSIRICQESLPSIAVGLFFVTSGFLVCASYIQRESLFAFIVARILRIFPGLFIAVLFCIFIIGAFASTETLLDYVLSASTWSFFKHNIFLVNGLQFDLPGVFIDNPYPSSVNGSLWTLPIEVWMYFWVAVLGSLSLLKDERVFNLFFIIISLMYGQASDNSFFIAQEPKNAYYSLLFMLGAFFYVNRHRLYLRFDLLSLLVLLVYFSAGHQFSTYLKAICFAYLVLLLALHPKCKLPSIDRWGDISYGLYIYAFPVQQMIAHLIPKIQPMTMFLLSSLITIILAILSWHLVEKPALKMKARIRFG